MLAARELPEEPPPFKRARSRREPPERIHVALPSWVGDVVMCTPALRALRRAYPDAHLVCEGRPHLEELLPSALFDAYVDGPPRGLRATVRRARELRRDRFDLSVLLAESERAALAPFLARVPVRAGYARGCARRVLLTDALARPLGSDGAPLAFSMVERYLRVMRMLGVPDAGDAMEVRVTDTARRTVDARLAALGVADDAPLATIVAGAAYGSAKTWPPEHFARAADRIFEERGWRAVLAPGPGEERLAAAVADASRTSVVALTGPLLGLTELAALLERSRVVLTNDTGPRSMAVALDRPVVALVGPSDEGHTLHHLERQRVLIEDVDCRPCGLKVCPIDHRCMARIEPERAVRAVDALVGPPGGTGD